MCSSDLEQNGSKTEGVHFLQIWIEPDLVGVTPSYEQKRFELAAKKGLQLIASPDGADGSVKINADARLHGAAIAAGQSASLAIASGRHAWVQVVRGEVKVNGQLLQVGDGASFSDEAQVSIEGKVAAEVLMFDLA